MMSSVLKDIRFIKNTSILPDRLKKESILLNNKGNKLNSNQLREEIFSMIIPICLKAYLHLQTIINHPNTFQTLI